jgi:hypothetical protein
VCDELGMMIAEDLWVLACIRREHMTLRVSVKE